MASTHIRKRVLPDGTNRYDVRYRRGGRYFPVEHAGTFTSLKHARIRADLVTGFLAANQDPRVMLAQPDRPPRLSVVAGDWLASKVRLAPLTRENYQRMIERMVAHLADPPVDAITPLDVRGYLDGMHAGTAKNALTVLRAVLDHAELEANPARHRSVQVPRQEHRDLQPPDAGELVAILTHLPMHYRRSLLIMEQCGLRVSEVMALEPGDIDSTEIRVRREVTKTKRPRVVPCPPWLAGTLDPPFGLTRQRVGNALAVAAKDAGTARYGPHQWRHRRATLWHLQGVPAVEVARRLGHAKVSMTLDTYTHARPVREADAQLLASLLM